MSSTVYKKIELTGASEISIEDAVNNAVAKTAETVRNLRWFEIDEIRGAIDEDKVSQWQVTLKIGFSLD